MATQHAMSLGNGYQRTSQQDPDERLANTLGWFSIGLGVAEVLAPGKLANLIGAPDSDRTHKVLRTFGCREIAQGIAILSQPRAAGWVWGRVAGDLLDIGTLAAGMVSEDSNRARASATAVALLGVTALDFYCSDRLSRKTPGTGTTPEGKIRLRKTIIVGRPPEEVYRYWRNFDNFPKFMNHLESVWAIDDRRSHWVAKGPAGRKVEWDAEIVEDQPNSRISWRTLPGSDIDNSGTVYFDRAPGGRGTLVRVELEYDPPAGKIGAVLAHLFGEDPEQQISDDLRAFKQILETGEKAISDASIFPGMHPAQPPAEVPEMAMAHQTK
jgi:uncharacterized membrane protein